MSLAEPAELFQWPDPEVQSPAHMSQIGVSWKHRLLDQVAVEDCQPRQGLRSCMAG